MRKELKYEKKIKFPYYIVRFKQKEMEASMKFLSEFPYYIVRFKRSEKGE